MLKSYFPILIFAVVCIIFSGCALLLGKLFSPFAPHANKNAQYECGFEPFEAPRFKFDVKFSLMAILFVIFDLEMAFLFPWALQLRSLDYAAFFAMAFFLLLLLIGFIYEWKKGALEWE